MIKEVTMEVVSLNEAEEMAYNNRIIDFEPTENGYLCTFLSEVHEKMPKIEVETKYLVYTETQSGVMYVSKKGKTTFYFSEAKTFSEKEAKTKAFFMTKNGFYKWNYKKA